MRQPSGAVVNMTHLSGYVRAENELLFARMTPPACREFKRPVVRVN